MRTIDDKEIMRLVTAFEDATIGRDEWKHAEHMIVGLAYLEMHGLELAYKRMRRGILNLLTSGFQIDLSKEMPYHETITVFWIKTLDEFRVSRPGRTLAEKANEVLEVYDKDYPLRFYSRECLFSEDARRRYIEPDLTPAPLSHKDLRCT